MVELIGPSKISIHYTIKGVGISKQLYIIGSAHNTELTIRCCSREHGDFELRAPLLISNYK